VKFLEAIREALDLCLAADPAVYVMGLGVPDPKGTFGTTLGLGDKYGADRVLDMPVAENGMTGIAIGSALAGMRPVMVHQRLDFALLAMEQIVNQAAKWHYMFDGRTRVPLVIRLIVGRGWGQGPQHSQSLQSWFAHVPGLKVVLPATPADAKGLLISSIEDDGPVIFIEHRWLHNTHGQVPEGMHRVPLGRAHVIRQGKDVTIVASSHMTIEALHAAELASEAGIDVEVVDLRTLRPLDMDTVLTSVRKTGRLIVADTGWKSFGASAEIVARVAEEALDSLKSPPLRIALPDCPVPTAASQANLLYPGAGDIVRAIGSLCGRPLDELVAKARPATPLDVPDPTFLGPF
jgi:pyruvate/2-oxoglutarate/acetoin dehydrogenase E1 component